MIKVFTNPQALVDAIEEFEEAYGLAPEEVVVEIADENGVFFPVNNIDVERGMIEVGDDDETPIVEIPFPSGSTFSITEW